MKVLDARHSNPDHEIAAAEIKSRQLAETFVDTLGMCALLSSFDLRAPGAVVKRYGKGLDCLRSPHCQIIRHDVTKKAIS